MPEKTSLDTFLQRELANRYLLTYLLGKGAMGRVYAAQDRLLADVEVAVKILSYTTEEDVFHQRFEKEAMACAALGQKSLHIVRVNDYGLTPEGMPFYVMEFLRGQTLRDIIKQTGALPLSRVINLAWQISLGLKAAHEGVTLRGQTVQVIHRDLKPANVMVLPNDSLGELVKIVDFGIAKLLTEQGHVSVTQGYTGTMAYSSPEQLEGVPLDARSDLYSFGVILYQMVMGRLPLLPTSDTFAGWYHAHQQQPPAPMGSDIPQALQSLILSCLAKKPQDRPQSAAQILASLEQFRDPLSFPLGVISTAITSQTAAPTTPPLFLARRAAATVHQTPRPKRSAALAMTPLAWILLVVGSLSAAILAVALPQFFPEEPPIATPSTYELAIQQGELALRQEEFQTAIRQFQVALDERPQDRLASSGLATAQRLYQASLATPTPTPTPTPPPTPVPTPAIVIPRQPTYVPPPPPPPIPRYTPLLPLRRSPAPPAPTRRPQIIRPSRN
ncbi:MAG: hypothetical protein OHK0012_13270 [Synechococcales cyanobacterium]